MLEHISAEKLLQRSGDRKNSNFTEVGGGGLIYGVGGWGRGLPRAQAG